MKIISKKNINNVNDNLCENNTELGYFFKEKKLSS